MKKPFYEDIVPDCPTCGSTWVLRLFYMDEPEYELEIEVRNEKVVIGKWKKIKRPDFHCIECDLNF